ncbi:MAG: type I-MYXAN CRISPR-associated endonuclease Cas1 [Deltaproteobacteria bacterium]|nr:type I-MYXAN CRISPR-associated endonuclease Cas1 [Deltaproteobacteria bacterium]
MDEPTLRVMSLHALAYCERLFYLEEVEELRVADERVFAGRTLHEQLAEEGELIELTLEDEQLGLRGRVDALRRRDGQLIPYEHKRGRCRDEGAAKAAWPSDRLQLGAYALLLERATGRPIPEGRVRYHKDNTLVRVPIDEALRAEVVAAVERARALSHATTRPPVTSDERRCGRCSLAPVCLPEETRKAADPDYAASRLFPADDERQTLHVLGHGTRIGREGERLKVTPLEGGATAHPIETVRAVVLHAYASVSAQALHLCADHGVAVHWFTGGGRYMGSFLADDLAVQRRIRQYEALRAPGFQLQLARRLVTARIEGQLRFLLRSSRGGEARPAGLESSLDGMRASLGAVSRADNPATLLGLEGQAAAAYFAGLPHVLSAEVDPALAPIGRSRRPPRDPFNAMLSFGYALLLREVVQAIRGVGLDAAFGFYHRPRSAAPPLALDLIELFRVPCVDMAVVAAVNRRQFDPVADFSRAGEQVWLSDTGRRKLIEVFERRLADTYKHPVLDYSLSYRRQIELEVRLLEKEWSGEPGLFARARIR